MGCPGAGRCGAVRPGAAVGSVLHSVPLGTPREAVLFLEPIGSAAVRPYPHYSRSDPQAVCWQQPVRAECSLCALHPGFACSRAALRTSAVCAACRAAPGRCMGRSWVPAEPRRCAHTAALHCAPPRLCAPPGHGRAGAVPHHHHRLLPRGHGLHPDVRHHQRGVLQRRAGLVSAAPNARAGHGARPPPTPPPPHGHLCPFFVPKGRPKSRRTRGTTRRCCWWGTNVTWRTSAWCRLRRAGSSPSTWVSGGGPPVSSVPIQLRAHTATCGAWCPGGGGGMHAGLTPRSHCAEAAAER